MHNWWLMIINAGFRWVLMVNDGWRFLKHSVQWVLSVKQWFLVGWWMHDPCDYRAYSWSVANDHGYKMLSNPAKGVPSGRILSSVFSELQRSEFLLFLVAQQLAVGRPFKLKSVSQWRAFRVSRCFMLFYCLNITSFESYNVSPWWYFHTISSSFSEWGYDPHRICGPDVFPCLCLFVTAVRILCKGNHSIDRNTIGVTYN